MPIRGEKANKQKIKIKILITTLESDKHLSCQKLKGVLVLCMQDCFSLYL